MGKKFIKTKDGAIYQRVDTSDASITWSDNPLKNITRELAFYKKTQEENERNYPLYKKAYPLVEANQNRDKVKGMTNRLKDNNSDVLKWKNQGKGIINKLTALEKDIRLLYNTFQREKKKGLLDRKQVEIYQDKLWALNDETFETCRLAYDIIWGANYPLQHIPEVAELIKQKKI